MNDLIPSTPPPGGEFLFYGSDDGRIRLQVRLEDETVWLTQKLMAELFQKDLRTVNEHLQNIFEEGELAAASVVRKFRITAADGKNYETAHYNLDVIISVGYRVKSLRGTQFRIWATQRLREYIVKGFAMDDERLKQRGGGNYFSHGQALRKAEQEFEKFHLAELAAPSQVERNFEVAVKELKKLPPPGGKKTKP